MSGGIEVTRPKGKGWRRDIFRRYKILIDEVEVASLKEGESHSAEVEPGDHRIQAKIDWTATPEVEVSVAAGEIVHFVVRPGGEDIHSAFTDPKGYLSLERV